MRFSAATTVDRWLPAPLAERARPLLARVDAALLSPGVEGAAGRMSFAAFVIRLVSAVIAFVSQVLLARWMGGFEYGIFVIVWVTVVIAGDLSCLGVHTSIVRFVPQYLEARKMAELRGLLLASRLFGLLGSTLIAALGILGIRYFSHSIESYYVVPFYLGMICIPMIALSDILQGIARANSWVMSALAPAYITRPALILLFLGGALAAGYPATAETAIISAILATYLTTVIQLIQVTARTDNRVASGPRAYEPAAWIAVSAPIFMVEGFTFLLTSADVLLIGLFMEPEAVAVYFAATKTLAVAHFVYFAVKAGVAPRFAHHAHAGNRERLAIFARETAHWTFWPTVGLALLLLAAGKYLLDLFGPGFGEGYPLLFVLVAGIVARASVGPAESLLTMSGHQKACAIAYAMTLALNIGLNVLLIPRFGLWGAAMATSAAMIFEAMLLAWTVRFRLGIVMAVFMRTSKAEA